MVYDFTFYFLHFEILNWKIFRFDICDIPWRQNPVCQIINFESTDSDLWKYVEKYEFGDFFQKLFWCPKSAKTDEEIGKKLGIW